MNSKIFLPLLAAPCLLLSSQAFAQSTADPVFVPDLKEAEVKAIDNIEKRRGVDGTLAVSANVNWVHNASVVGQVEGSSFIIGVGLMGGLDWIHGRHEIRNTLTIDESISRTPVLDRWVKNSDLLSLSSQYNYFFLDWMGAFGRFGLEASLFPNTDYRANEVTYSIKELGSTTPTLKTGKELKISGAFQPISLSQSLGVIMDPLRSEPISLTIRAGLGARESFNKGVYAVKDDKKTTEIEVEALDNVFQLGMEGFAGGHGSFQDGRISYEFGVSVLAPFVTNSQTQDSAFSFTRIGFNGSLNVAVFSWMGLTGKAMILRDPQVISDWQVQTNLLATFNYTFIKRGENVGQVSDLEETKAELSAAEERAKEAEAAAAAAEKRAKEAEAAAAKAKATAAADKAENAAEKAEKAADEAEGAVPSIPPKAPAEPETPPSNPANNN